MSGEKTSLAQPGFLELGRNGNLGSLFFEGLPTMTGIVTIIAQPFAQDSMKNVFALPDWLPAVIALAAAGLLALHRTRIVKKLGTLECAICCPLLVFIIFSAYASGNNIVYYAKEGIAKAGSVQRVSSGKEAEEKLTKEGEEIKILKEQLLKANELIRNMATVLNISQNEPMKEERPSVSSLFRLSAMLGVNLAYAQNQGPEGGMTQRPRQPDAQQLQKLQEALRQYEQTQQKLDKRLEDVRKQEKSTPQPQSPPLIKSW